MKTSENKTYFIGIAWFIMSIFVSISLDIVQKYLGQNLHCTQITFMRFLFGTLSLLPFMFFYGKESFYTSRFFVHILRGAMLFGGIALWCYGLKIVPISMVTTISFTIPLFTIVLAIFFLKEKVGLARWLATIVGFFGILLIFNPFHESFNPSSFLLVGAAAMFAGLDVINKKFVVKESMLAMLFYTALVTTVIGAVPATVIWVTPSLEQIGLLALLGCGANLILFCLLNAFKNADASAIAPFRYIELIFSTIAGFLLFNEIPSMSILWGALIIIPSSLYVIYAETRKKKETDLINEPISEPIEESQG